MFGFLRSEEVRYIYGGMRLGFLCCKRKLFGCLVIVEWISDISYCIGVLYSTVNELLVVVVGKSRGWLNERSKGGLFRVCFVIFKFV